MSLQYIIDEKGHATGVFIPIREWNNLKKKFHGIEDETNPVPEWQKEIVNERFKNTKPEEYVSWEEVRQKLKIG